MQFRGSGCPGDDFRVCSRHSDSMGLPPGTRLGPYRIEQLLGAGGMGEVYRAADTRLDRTVAIKVIPDHLSGDCELRERFEREARAVSSLNHPTSAPCTTSGSRTALTSS